MEYSEEVKVLRAELQDMQSKLEDITHLHTIALDNITQQSKNIEGLTMEVSTHINHHRRAIMRFTCIIFKRFHIKLTTKICSRHIMNSLIKNVKLFKLEN